MTDALWQVRDGVQNYRLLMEAAESWPAKDWPGWHRYDSPLEQKSTCNTWPILPAPCQQLLTRLLADVPLGHFGLVPDITLYGAGMSGMWSGEHLDLHLDATHHAVYGLERRLNAVLFLSEKWEPEWGGALEFFSSGEDGQPQEQLTAIQVRFNRLVIWEASDTIYHGIPAPLDCPDGVCRKTLSAFFYGYPRYDKPRRTRALFAPLPGQDNTAELDRLRRERAA